MNTPSQKHYEIIFHVSHTALKPSPCSCREITRPPCSFNPVLSTISFYFEQLRIFKILGEGAINQPLSSHSFVFHTFVTHNIAGADWSFRYTNTAALGERNNHAGWLNFSRQRQQNQIPCPPETNK